MLNIQYDGSNYNGWQIQSPEKNKIITIQGILQDAIYNLTGKYCNVIAAGRTDAGVHALSQIASFLTTSTLKTEVIKRALNAKLPHDIRIIEVIEREIDFNPRFDATSKIYSYFISHLDVVSPFIARYSWNIPYKLDIDAMLLSASVLVGRHDFSAFRGSGCGAKSPERTIFSLLIQPLNNIDFMTFSIKGEFIKITIEADAFLRHMVRNIVGTIFEIGRKRFKPEDMERILLIKNRTLAGQTAPARGLFLEKINY